MIDYTRAEHAFHLTFGDVVKDEAGRRWAFIGWRRNTAGLFAVFAPDQQEAFTIGQWDPHVYNASTTETLLRKFPSIVRYQLQGAKK